ncbi:Kinetochore mis13 [Lecanosticta acicola]|uniref:Kinetochore mis13 n=1 Tax=Lecanosticta acicola TaxID=111012 RepID=A0AAI8YUI0_9PEZI|nr:Kinetochore mis13 [Lecanosticta acicola]
MSIVLTRSPLEPIGMNGGGVEKRRSARLSHEGIVENEPPAKKTKTNGAATSTTTVNTKQQDGEGSKAATKRKRKVYDEEDDGFTFSKGKRGKAKDTKQPATAKSSDESRDEDIAPSAHLSDQQPAQPLEDIAPKTTQKKTRRRLPTTPERDGTEKRVRRSKRLSTEKEPEAAPKPSPHRPSHAKSHANTQRDRSSSPVKAKPVTVEKKRRHGANGVEEEKIMMISLPFADTPIIKRNKEMRKTSAEGSRRSSAGMRGKRASSLIDEGRGQALPHEEVPASEFFKHISADLTENRRMRCLLGWCGSRALPPKPDPPKDNTAQARVDFQALQAARIIQDELSQELMTNGTLSDWFSRDESAPPQIPLRKKPNPRNVTNAAKADELERELERLKKERAEWDELEQAAGAASASSEDQPNAEGEVSTLRPDVLDSPQRAIYEQLQSSEADLSTDPERIQQRLRTISDDLEFALDQFAHGVHALSTTRETAEKVAERSLADAANALEERQKQRAGSGKPVDQMDALRGLARVLNSQYR